MGVGIARVTGSRFVGRPGIFASGRRADINPTIGVPIEVRLFARLSRASGFGLYVYTNVNEEHSFGGVTLCLQLGKLR